MKIGDIDITNPVLGTTPINEVRLGTVLIWRRLNPPEQITGLAASNITETSLRLTWDTTAGAEKYRVRRKIVGEADFTLIRASHYTNYYDDSGLSKNTSYEYRVEAVNTDGATGTTITVKTLFLSPAQITGLSISNLTETSLRLSWNAADRADYYRVRRKIVGESSYTLISNSQTRLFYDDSGLTKNVSYEYRVEAHNQAGTTSATITVTTPILLPEALTGLASSNITENSLTLTWNQSDGADYYRVRRRILGEDSFNLISNSQTALVYNDSGLMKNTTYEYRVEAHNDSGSRSAVISVKTLLLSPDLVTGITFSNVTPTSLTVSWNASARADNYIIRRRIKGDTGGGTRIGATPATTFNNTGLVANTTYEYQIVAENEAGTVGSQWAEVITGEDVEPLNVKAVARIGNQLVISWDNIGASSHDVYIRENGNIPWILTGSTGTGTSITSTYTYVNKVIYDVRVIAHTSSGDIEEIITYQYPYISVNITTTSSVFINWAAEPNAVSYSLYYRKVGDPNFILSYQGTELTAKTQGLEKSTTYEFFLQINFSDGSSITTNILRTTTNAS